METLFYDLPRTSAKLRQRLQKQLKVVRRDCENLSEWRHRHYAHRDKSTALMEHAVPLKPVTVRTMRNAIRFFGRALTAISNELRLDNPYDVDRELAKPRCRRVDSTARDRPRAFAEVAGGAARRAVTGEPLGGWMPPGTQKAQYASAGMRCPPAEDAWDGRGPGDRRLR